NTRPPAEGTAEGAVPPRGAAHCRALLGARYAGVVGTELDPDPRLLRGEARRRPARLPDAEHGRLLGHRGDRLDGRSGPAEAECDPLRQGPPVRSLLQRPASPPDRAAGERRDLLGRELPPELALERDDARHRQGSAASQEARVVARVAIFGAGYAGLVTGACFAELGHTVVVRDVLPEKLEALRQGHSPFHERGLEELLARNRGRVRFTLDAAEAAEEAEFLFVCVGTPPTPAGDADLSDAWTVLHGLP